MRQLYNAREAQQAVLDLPLSVRVGHASRRRSEANTSLILATEAQLIWRIKKDIRLPCEMRLAYGSYLRRIYPSEKDRRHQTKGLTVRVIEYRLDGVAGAEPIYRWVPSLL
ncbi:MAG: hypothetical protein ACR2FI_01930 [Burkholderiales bacterium]|nr:hypothetical protein [Pseudomonadota bacterium]